MKRIFVASIPISIALLVITLHAQSRGTPNNLRVNVDANGYLVTASAVQTLPITGVRFSDARLATDASGNLLTTNGASSSFLPLIIGGSTASSTLTLQSTSGVGTTDAIIFLVGSNGGTKAGKFYSNGNFEIGTPCTQTGCNSLPLVDFFSTGAAAIFDRFNSAAGGYQLIARHARGTVTAPAQTQTNDVLAQLVGRGWESTTPAWTTGNNGSFNIFAGENYTSTNQGSKATIVVTPNGSTTQQTPLTISAGGLLTGGSTPTVANVGANSCGTTTATIAGNNIVGEVTVGATSGTQCRVTMTQAATTRFDGACTNTTTANLCRLIAVDTTHFDLLGTFSAADVVSYVVMSR